jgi:hypothetical protein
MMRLLRWGESLQIFSRSRNLAICISSKRQPRNGNGTESEHLLRSSSNKPSQLAGDMYYVSESEQYEIARTRETVS